MDKILKIISALETLPDEWEPSVEDLWEAIRRIEVIAQREVNHVQRAQSDWSVQVIEDSDGHLNIYVTNSESKKLWDVEGDHNGDELHYRITTEEIERKYRE